MIVSPLVAFMSRARCRIELGMEGPVKPALSLVSLDSEIHWLAVDCVLWPWESSTTFWGSLTEADFLYWHCFPWSWEHSILHIFWWIWLDLYLPKNPGPLAMTPNMGMDSDGPGPLEVHQQRLNEWLAWLLKEQLGLRGFSPDNISYCPKSPGRSDDKKHVYLNNNDNNNNIHIYIYVWYNIWYMLCKLYVALTKKILSSCMVGNDMPDAL